MGAFSLLLALALAACSLLPGGPALPGAPAPSSTPGASTATSEAATPVTGAPTPTATSSLEFLEATHAPGTLTVWLPPEFNPAQGTRAAEVLRERLAAFEQQHGVKITVRIKDVSGPGGLLESLTAAAGAAPLTLPSVIALPRSGVEAAAAASLIQPLDGLSTVIDEPDWYAYARDLGMVNGAAYALPFAGDALLLAYRPSQITTPPADWESIFRLDVPLAFPAGDNQTLLQIALYQSLGGEVADSQRRAAVQPDVLARVFQVLADGEQRGLFPYWLSQYETYPQVWQAYKEDKIAAQVAWASSYLNAPMLDSTAVPLPGLNGQPATLATGWAWAIADPVPERRALAADLAEFLSDGAFLSRWTESAGYLPTRPSSLAAWGNTSLKVLLSSVAVSARARPSDELVAVLGPVLKEASLKVLKRDLQPLPAAQSAAERLNGAVLK